MTTTIKTATTLDCLRMADENLTAALNCLRQARENELSAARACVNDPRCEDEHARHLLCNRALIEAERLATAAREILS